MAPAVRAYVAAEIALHPDHEAAFVCSWDAGARRITSATLLQRGRRDQVFQLSTDYRPGSLALHSHPPGSSAVPSSEDLDAARDLASHGVGFAICDHTADSLFLVREPRPTWQFLEPRPAVKSRSWFWWRFQLTYRRLTR
jgi:hypothetical protein